MKVKYVILSLVMFTGVSYEGKMLGKSVLSQHETEVNKRDSRGRTALMRAALAANDDDKQVKKIKELIAVGEDVNAQDKDGNTALMLAVNNLAPEATLKALLVGGARADLRNKAGETVYDMTIDPEDHDRLVRILQIENEGRAPRSMDIN